MMKTPRLHISDIDPLAKDIPGFQGYRVTPSGNVWSSRWPGGRNGVSVGSKWHLISVHKRNGYPVVNLWYKGRQRMTGIHILILETFVGPRPQGMDACHNDGNPANCHLHNLRWDTRSNNNLDAVRHGTFLVGEKHPFTSLTDSQVIAAREAYRAGESQASISRRLRLSAGTTHSLVHGKTWKHLLRDEANAKNAAEVNALQEQAITN